MTNKLESGLYPYDREFLPQVVTMTLFDEWKRNAPEFLNYGYIGYCEEYFKVTIDGCMTSGTMYIGNREHAEKYNLTRVMGQIHFYVDYGKYNEELYLKIDQMRYDNGRIGKQLGLVAGEYSRTMVEFSFYGYTQGFWHEEQEMCTNSEEDCGNFGIMLLKLDYKLDIVKRWFCENCAYDAEKFGNWSRVKDE